MYGGHTVALIITESSSALRRELGLLKNLAVDRTLVSSPVSTVHMPSRGTSLASRELFHVSLTPEPALELGVSMASVVMLLGLQLSNKADNVPQTVRRLALVVSSGDFGGARLLLHLLDVCCKLLQVLVVENLVAVLALVLSVSPLSVLSAVEVHLHGFLDLWDNLRLGRYIRWFVLLLDGHGRRQWGRGRLGRGD